MIIISYLFLIFVCVIGILGLFLFNDYIKKISSLSVAYSSLLILLALVIYNNNNDKLLEDIMLEKTLDLFISLLLIFSINLMIALGIIKNIGEVALNEEVSKEAHEEAHEKTNKEAKNSKNSKI